MKRKSLFQLCLLITIISITHCIDEREESSLPELITVPVSDITIHSAVLGGFIISDGGSDVSARGIYWGTGPDPEISGSKSDAGSKGIGRFTCKMTGFNQNTLYYAKAYATNSKGTAFGNKVHFTTKPAHAASVEAEIILISYYRVCLGVIVADDGGTDITEKGICWATKENPSVINNDTIVNHPSYDEWPGDEYCINHLSPKSAYHARAYAINIVDTSYSQDVSITTLSVPEVIIGQVNEITSNSATIGGSVTSIGDVRSLDEIEVGICYGTNKSPTINSSHIKADPISTGEFISNLTGLAPSTLYHARAYVLWGEFDFQYEYIMYTLYSEDITFTTGEPTAGNYFP